MTLCIYYGANKNKVPGFKMTQSVCSRCIKALTEAEKRRKTLLCYRCEPAWEHDLESTVAAYEHTHPEALDVSATPELKPGISHKKPSETT